MPGGLEAPGRADRWQHPAARTLQQALGTDTSPARIRPGSHRSAAMLPIRLIQGGLTCTQFLRMTAAGGGGMPGVPPALRPWR